MGGIDVGVVLQNAVGDVDGQSGVGIDAVGVGNAVGRVVNRGNMNCHGGDVAQVAAGVAVVGLVGKGVVAVVIGLGIVRKRSVGIEGQSAVRRGSDERRR